VHLELETRLRLGVSSCLTGEAVRYDGGHKRDHWLMDRLAAFSDLVPFCPEAVLGVPREPVSLHRTVAGDLRVVGNESGTDYSRRLAEATGEFLGNRDLDELDGWVFKARSPSCAVRPIEVFEDGKPSGESRGRFAERVLEDCAWLPAVDEEELADPALRRHFLERAFARAHWRQFAARLGGDPEARGAAVDEWLDRFELQLVARERRRLPPLGPGPQPSALRSGAHLLFASLDAAPTRAGQVAALRQAGDHLDVLDDELAALAILIGEYESGNVDVEVPRQLLRGLCARGGDTWLRGQRFLDPFPPAWRDPDVPSLPFAPARDASTRRP
jgi:uncharacterized protein YbbK (DUF523 family)